MDLMLLALTALSLAAALVFGGVAWRLARDERARSLARIAALGMAADAEPVVAAPAAPGSTATAAPGVDELPPTWTFPARVAPRAAALARAQEPARRLEPALELGIVPVVSGRSANVGEAFLRGSTDTVPADGRQRTLALAAIALLVAMVGGVAWTYVGATWQRDGQAALTAAPLELVALRHERQGDTLAVSGTVRNPAAGQAVDGVSAIVQLFDQTGALVTRGQAQIDFLRLAPGDESPFVIAVAAPATVARYRVSFTNTAGTMPHVDRRREPAASPVAPAAARVAAPGQ